MTTFKRSNRTREDFFRPRYDTQPVFSPDGRRITFVSNTDGNGEIYLMKADGSAAQRITRNLADDASPG